MQLTDSDFTRLYTYVKNSYGIDLSKKKQLISSRLNNMLIQQGYRDFTQYTDEIISRKKSGNGLCHAEPADYELHLLSSGKRTL